MSAQDDHTKRVKRQSAETRDRTGDLQIFSLTLSQLSYRGDGALELVLIMIYPRAPPKSE